MHFRKITLASHGTEEKPGGCHKVKADSEIGSNQEMLRQTTIFRDWTWRAERGSKFPVWLLSDLGTKAGTPQGQFCRDSNKCHLGYELQSVNPEGSRTMIQIRRDAGDAGQLLVYLAVPEAIGLDELPQGAHNRILKDPSMHRASREACTGD